MKDAFVGIDLGDLIVKTPYLETIGDLRILIDYTRLDQKPEAIVAIVGQRENSGVGLERLEIVA